MDISSTEMLKFSLSADLCVGVTLAGHFCSELDCEIPLWADQSMAQGNIKSTLFPGVNQRGICKGPAFIILHGCVLWEHRETISSPSITVTRATGCRRC